MAGAGGRCPAASGGLRTTRASRATRLSGEATRGLMGQMPHTHDLTPGISHRGRRSQNFSKPCNSVTWNQASVTCPLSSS
jgi:hypothetical protein